MSWYSDGTIEVAEGGDVATGTGTAFIANVRVGDGIAIAGSATLHEVTNIASNLQLTFQPPFAGQAGNGLAYRIAPVQGYVKRAADRLAQIVADYGDTLAALGDEETRQLVIELAENITPAGLELMGKATATEQRQVLSLDRVDNTPDAEKPVSTPQLQALNAKAGAEEVAAALAGKAGTEQVVQGLAGKVDKEAGKGLSHNDLTDELYQKLASIEGSRWQGVYISLQALATARPDGQPGWFAWVDAGAGQPVKMAIWDIDDAQWRISSGEGGTMTPAQVLEALKANADVNVLTDAQLAKLVETLMFTQAQKDKLDGIQPEAQKNPDAATQAEAAAGMVTALRSWSVSRVWQAIQAWWNASAMKTKLDAIPAMPPSDGKSYVLKDGAWVESSSGGNGANLLDVKFFHGYRSAIATECPGWLPIDGQLVERSLYPPAVAKIMAGNLYPLAASDAAWGASWAEKRKFSPGNGSTTIRFMDWNGATGGKAVFPRGSKTDSFSLKEDMIQNITGQLTNNLGQSGLPIVGSGAFQSTKASDIASRAGTGAQTDGYLVTFDASRVARTGTETVPAHAEGVWLICMANAPADPGTVDVNALATEVATLKARNGALIKETIYTVPGAISHTFAVNCATYEVEVWGAGAPGGARNTTAPGGTTTFGSVSATGGGIQLVQGDGLSGEPGIGIGGDVNLSGFSGAQAPASFPGMGGGAPMGAGTSSRSQSPVMFAVGGIANGNNVGGASGGYARKRAAVVGGSTITGIVGAAGVAGSGGLAGGHGRIVVREFASSGPSLDTIATILDQIKPVVMSGQIGTALLSSSAASPLKVPFADFKATSTDIVYDSTNRRFYVNKSGVYHILGSAHGVGTGNRLLIGLNTDTPTPETNLCNSYGPANVTVWTNATVRLNAGDYLVFYVSEGAIYNQLNNRFGSFAITKVAP